jgi:hypothetical protein
MQNHTNSTDFPLSDATGSRSAVPGNPPGVEILSDAAQRVANWREVTEYFLGEGLNLPASVWAAISSGRHSVCKSILVDFQWQTELCFRAPCSVQ